MNNLAQGCLTKSKHPKSLSLGAYPILASHYEGDYLISSDNKRYLDFIGALGAHIYPDQLITPALINQLNKGVLFSIPHEIVINAARRFKELLPWVERVKFLKTGSGACQAAIRIARCYTQRTQVFSCGYHGWHSDFCTLDPACGVPVNTRQNITHTDRISLIRYLRKAHKLNIAAIILEPVETEDLKSQQAYLLELRELCDRHHIMLIFDEVITAFRVPRYTVARYLGIKPDLIITGKAMANGLPLAAVGGSAALMDDPDYFVSGTYFGETLSLAAFLRIANIFTTPPYDIETLWEDGKNFQTQFNAIDHTIIQIKGYPTRGVLHGTQLEKGLFMQEMAKSGYLFGPSFVYTHLVRDHTKKVIDHAKSVIQRIKNKEVKLESNLPIKPFSSKRDV